MQPPSGAGGRLGSSDAARRMVVVQPRGGGHRLVHVAALCSALSERSAGHVELVSTAAAVGGAEAALHLAKVSVPVTVLPPKAFRGLRLLRLLCQRRRDVVVLPEADEYLGILVLSRAFGGGRTVALFIRPPQATVLPVNRRSVKRVLLEVISFFPSVRAFALEDPLATGSSEVWFKTRPKRVRRVDDPADASLVSGSLRPPELEQLSDGSPLVSIVGSIDSRKRAPEVARAWLARQDAHGVLLIAGRQSADVARELDALGLADRLDAIVIDRYMADEEVRWVLEHSTATVALYDGGLPSGIIAACASLGTPLVLLKDGRPARALRRHGLGMETSGNHGDLASALDRVVAQGGRGTALNLPGIAEFCELLAEAAIS